LNKPPIRFFIVTTQSFILGISFIKKRNFISRPTTQA
jgi:hypothetical protein